MFMLSETPVMGKLLMFALIIYKFKHQTWAICIKNNQKSFSVAW